MAKEYLEHITGHGERWDLIAYDHYGDAKLLQPLFEANPGLLSNPERPAPLVFDPGTLVIVPILPEDVATKAQLPIWKRQ